MTLVDVRTPAEFREMHVAGAVNKPLDRLQPADFLQPVDFQAKPRPLYVICRSGSRGAMACEKLAAAGVDEVVNIDGGSLACAEVGVEMRYGKKAMSLERQVRIAAGTLVVAGVVLGVTVHAAWLGLAGFVGAGLVFAGVTDTCGMGLLIARMPWNQAAAPTDATAGSAACSADARRPS